MQSNYISFNFLDEAQLDLLNNDELIQYMDKFLTHREYEKSLQYEEKHRSWAVQKGPRVSEFQATQFYKDMEDGDLQRKIIRKLFDFILHTQYLVIHPSWSNAFVYENGLYKSVKDRSPSIQIYHAHLNQSCIMTAFNQLEILIDLIYLIEKGSSGPKTNKFITDIFVPQTKWIYFLPHMIDLFTLRKLRHKETHSGSIFPREIVIGNLSGELSNKYMLLGTILMNFWRH